MANKFFKINFICLTALLLPFFCLAADVKPDYFKIDKGCAVNMKDESREIICKVWNRGSQAVVEGINVGTCICANTCLKVPAKHYYYDDPVAKHKQTDEQNITLPVVLAWDNAEGWQKNDGSYLWYWKAFTTGGKESITNEIFGVQSYVLEIDNTNNVLNDKNSAGKIFRRILTTNEFNPTKEFYPCFFNSDSVIKWRVRPCCGKDGSNCMPEEQAAWWVFTTSSAPEPMEPKDPDWTGKDGAKNLSFKTIQPRWCKAKVSTEKIPHNNNYDYSLSYQIRVYSNENDILNLANQAIPAEFSKYAQWLLKNSPILTSPLSCHYSMKQKDSTCKGDAVLAIKPDTPRNFWSHQEYPNSDRTLFTKNVTYYWQVRSCFGNKETGEDSCYSASEKNWGQIWSFTTKNESIDAPRPTLPPNDNNYINPEDTQLTELPVKMAWTVPNGANSFLYDIQEVSGNNSTSLVSGGKKAIEPQAILSKNFGNQANNNDVDDIKLKIDTPYKWKVKSCWPSLPLGDVCEPEWSQWFTFRTTGRAPLATSLKPENLSNNLAIPVTLQWELIGGAKSYNLLLGDQKINVKSNQYVLDYPTIKQTQPYSWKVQTCADESGNMCGKETAEISFMTAALGASDKPQYPQADSTIDNSQLTYNFNWDNVLGARYYKLTMNYFEKSDKETNNDCVVGKKIETTVNNNSATVNRAIDQLYCLGKYQWSVLACFDNACADKGADPNIWSFTLVPGGKEVKQGETILAVCGLNNDNPNTQWDDREDCGIKHTFLTIQQIINFIIFKLSLLLLPLLVLITGILYYTRFGGPELLEKIKSLWKYAGIGYAVLLFAWTLVGIALRIFGYTGNWWNI